MLKILRDILFELISMNRILKSIDNKLEDNSSYKEPPPPPKVIAIPPPHNKIDDITPKCDRDSILKKRYMEF